MRYRTVLIIATLALLAPASLYAQVETIAPTDKAAQSRQAEKAASPQAKAPATIRLNRTVPTEPPYYMFVSNQKIGQPIEVTFYDHQIAASRQISGRLSAVRSAYFEMVNKDQIYKVVYTDITDIKEGKTIRQRLKRIGTGILILPVVWVVLPAVLLNKRHDESTN